ncbi:MAG: hypothetical protein P8J86_06915 [Phycisphaerales bacterium]|nr:hypothetical protein [Phycisphaerales bacterium]
MRWWVFFIALVVSIALDLAFVQVMRIDSLGALVPCITIALVVFVALFAPVSAALWAAWVAGLLLDLSLPQISGGQVTYFLIGPHALGFVAGAAVVLQMRTAVFRYRALTIGVLSLVAMMAAGIVVVAVHAVRLWLPWTDISPGQAGLGLQLVNFLGVSVYSGLVAIPIGWLLKCSWQWWGFTGSARTVV